MTKEKALEVLTSIKDKTYSAPYLYAEQERIEALQIAIEVLEQDLKPKECEHYFPSDVVDGKRSFLPCEFCGQVMN
jgi:hypothetical protein